MDIPKNISRNNHEYIFVEQCNDNLFRYQDINTKVYECFTLYDLGLVKAVIPKVKNIKVERIGEKIKRRRRRK